MKATRYWHHKARWQRVTRLMARDGSDCTICKQPLDRHLRDLNHPHYITFDHIVPRARGGTDQIDNLRLAHRRCNMERGCDPVMPEEEVAP